MFAKGRRPRGPDVVCAHKWDSQKPVLELLNGRHHTAGMFRIYTGHYMYFGFDRDFGPLCLITTRNPRSRRFTVLESNLETLSNADALRLLDLNWLRAQIGEGTASGHAILAFKGERRTRTEVECSSLSLHLVFEWRYSEITKMQSWHVAINQLERNRRQGTSPPVDELSETSSPGFTSPFEVSRLARALSAKREREHHARNDSEPQISLGTPPRIKVVDYDGESDVRVIKEMPTSYAFDPQFETAPGTPIRLRGARVEMRDPVNDNNDVRVYTPPDRPSGFVIRGNNADGNAVITREQPAYRLGRPAAQRPVARTPSPRLRGLVIDERDVEDRRRPRSR